MPDGGRSRRRDVTALTLVVFFLGFFALATLGWLIETPVETAQENYSNGQLAFRQTDVDYGSLIVPGALCVASLLAFTASALALARTLRERDRPA